MPVFLMMALTLTQVPTAVPDRPAAPEYNASSPRSSRSTARAAITTRIAKASSRSRAMPRCSVGQPHGPALLPGDRQGSRIIRLVKGVAKPLMPPKDEPRPTAE